MLLERLDIATKEKRVAEMERASAQPDFWNDNVAAQKAMRELTALKDEVTTWRNLARGAQDALALLEMAIEEQHAETAQEIETETAALEKQLSALEFNLLFAGEFDRNNAILSIHAGAGGTESQDWAAMLMRMFLRYAESRGYQTDIVEETPGEEAGIKSVSIEMVGAYAYGRLRAERGVHRLVRQSPFDANHRRHTSFALVEVVPEVEDAAEIEIKPEDVKVDVYHASGHGGQNVQKVSTAVRLTHVPTGIIVTCQNQRSQLQNKEFAFKVLRSRLIEAEIERKELEKMRLKGKHVEAGWGNQIRSYVLHPYQMVKDHRTEHETSRTDLVLDGDLDAFIEAYLKSQVGQI
ncbi:MAG: peptide chain release factor 2 [Chloroflexi bacterium]|nr:peptide chain release factor 2 [Chloroflexota bacterium]